MLGRNLSECGIPFNELHIDWQNAINHRADCSRIADHLASIIDLAFKNREDAAFKNIYDACSVLLMTCDGYIMKADAVIDAIEDEMRDLEGDCDDYDDC